MSFPKRTPILLFFLGLALLGGIAAASQSGIFISTYEARVIRVIDGDTFKAEILLTDGLSQIASIRLHDVDAPETKKRCAPKVRLLGKKSKKTFKSVLGKKVWLRDLERGKYAGRMLAHVYNEEGVDVGAYMLEKGLARPYREKSKSKSKNKGAKRRAWCL